MRTVFEAYRDGAGLPTVRNTDPPRAASHEPTGDTS